MSSLRRSRQSPGVPVRSGWHRTGYLGRTMTSGRRRGPFAIKKGGRAMNEQNLAIDTFVPALRTLAGVLDKAAAHAREKGTDPQALLQERLAPDIFPLSS